MERKKPTSTLKIFNPIIKFLNSGHKRSARAKKNIAASFAIKGTNILIGLIMVPLIIDYLDPTKYGIWITLSSVIAWFGFFDIGLGNGLRNRFAEALASGKHDLAKTYISTTYAILTIIIGLVLIFFFFVNPFLNWNSVLNADETIVDEHELEILASVVFTFFCARFIFKLITTILTADQQPAKASLFELIGRILALVIIYVLTQKTSGSLLYLGITVSAAPVIVLILSSIWFYNGKYKAYRPGIKSIDFSKASDLFNLGFKFFIIQIAAVLLYQTNNIIITQLFGPVQVTPYNIAFRYFTILMMGFIIVINPFWSAITEAWIKKELGWIKNTVKKLRYLWFLLVIMGIAMLITSKWVYQVWIGDKVTISYIMSAFVGAWVLLNAWNGIYSHFLNGVGKIKLQLYLGITAAALNIPLAIFLGLKIGVEGVLLSNVILAFIQSLIYPIQYKKIITGNAQGIWNK